MTLYLIGLGLYDEKDITLRGLEILKGCDHIYLEHYTSLLGIGHEPLENLCGRHIELASRDLVESEAEEKLLTPAKEHDVALLVVGDVFGATTHTDLFLRAKEQGISIEVINNASIMNAIGIVGLELYKYGKTTSIVFPDDDWLPETPYDTIKNNRSQHLHTLCLLDIKVAEPSKEDLRKSTITRTPVTPQPPRYMTINQGLEVLRRLEQKRNENIIDDDMIVIGVARIGQPDMIIKAGRLKELLSYDFGEPLHSIIIPAPKDSLQTVEEEMMRLWS